MLSCSPTQHIQGNLLDLDDVKKIEVGRTTKGDVRTLLGPPSSQELFGRDAWYYMGDKVENKSFFKPKVTERTILVVTFADNNTVSPMN